MKLEMENRKCPFNETRRKQYNKNLKKNYPKIHSKNESFFFFFVNETMNRLSFAPNEWLIDERKLNMW